MLLSAISLDLEWSDAVEPMRGVISGRAVLAQNWNRLIELNGRVTLMGGDSARFSCRDDTISAETV